MDSGTIAPIIESRIATKLGILNRARKVKVK